MEPESKPMPEQPAVTERVTVRLDTGASDVSDVAIGYMLAWRDISAVLFAAMFTYIITRRYLD